MNKYLSLCFLLLCSSVAVATYSVPNKSITQAKMAPRPGPSPTVTAGGFAQSSSSSSFSTSSGTAADVTNLSVTITTTGRPVFVGVIPDGNTSNRCMATCSKASAGSNVCDFFIVKTSTNIGVFSLQLSVGATPAGTIYSNQPCGAIHTIDTPAAGTYTYKVQAKSGDNSTTAGLTYATLIAYEL